jgi:hypothetical protein
VPWDGVTLFGLSGQPACHDHVMEGMVVVVTGIPASGKSTVATALSAQLKWPLISKDVSRKPSLMHLGLVICSGLNG